VLLGVSIFGALHVKVGLEISTLIPSNSAESRTYTLMNDNFNSSLPLFIVVLSGPTGEEGCLDYADSRVPKTLLAMKTALEAAGGLSDTLSFWYSDFVSWIVFLKPAYRNEYYANNEAVPDGKLIPWLNEFLSSEGATHMMTLKRSSPVANSTRFSASLMMGSLVPLDGLQLILSAVKTIETEMKPYVTNSTLNCAKIVPYSPVFFALGQVDSFNGDAIRVVLASLAVVFLMTLIFIHNLVISFLAVLVLSGLCVSIFALHIPLSLQLNGITIVNIALGLTLASEYLSYYMRAYISSRAAAQDSDAKPASTPACSSVAPAVRTVAAFSSVGGMLVLSILSSILGMIVLLFTGYKIIRIYFGAMWLLIISLAALFALALFPWTLAILSRLQHCKCLCCRCGNRPPR
jgi:predicted RND superfamily exporter protein